jgi:signal transduction histidine kinase
MTTYRPTLKVKTTISGTLTQAYLRKLGKGTYLATAITIFVVTFSLLWMMMQIGSQAPDGKTPVLAFFANVMYALTSFIGAIWCFEVAYRARRGPVRLQTRHQLSWLLIALALLSNGIGGVIYTYLEDYVMKNPEPSPADVFFTLPHLLIFAGLLLMPTAIKAGQSRIRIGLDAAITTLCILEFSWYFSIKQIFETAADSWQVYVSASYPFWDILLVLAIVYVLYQRVEPQIYPSLILCAIGIGSQIWADTIYAVEIPPNTYSTGTWYVDTFWFLGFLLIGLSGLYQYASIARSAFRDHLHSPPEIRSADYFLLDDLSSPRRCILSSQMFMTYIPLLSALGLILYGDIIHTDDLFFTAVAGLIGFLVVLRWFISNNENDILLKERESHRAEADLLRRLTSTLSEELRLNSLLSRIVTAATTELGFDAATLLLIEDYDQPVDAQSSLLVRATYVNTAEDFSWSLQGEDLPFCSVLNGKPAEVLWSEETIELPEVVLAWHQEQRLLSTLFIPLTYQGKIQGSLGFSSRTTTSFNQREMYLATAFAEQASRAIEHTHLYEEAQEHELFAKALTAVAARLNAAITIEPGVGDELYQMICAEAARALQADYAILYIPSGSNNGGSELQAIASYRDGQETASQAPLSWPSIASYEQDAHALNAPQPTLIEIDLVATSGHLPVAGGLQPVASAVAAASAQHQADTAPLRALLGSLRGHRLQTLRSALARRKAQTAILAPLIAGDEAVALLVLARTARHEAIQRRPFMLSDLSRAQDFAEQAAIAFSNARLYQQLRDTHRKLQELDELKDQFMVTASHELRTPLTAVQGYLELLAQFGPNLPRAQQQEFLQKARRGCDELVLLLSNVMDASRLEIEAGIRPAHLLRIPVKEVISDVITLIEPQAKLDRRLIQMFVPDQLCAKVDAARLRQVLLNLSSNALKYSPLGTPITYRARAVPDRSAAIISVSDRGPGIRPEDQARLFQRFTRLERDLNSSTRGSGLGLYISRRLIEAMNGRIWVESSGNPGAGTTFHIQLPLA